MTGTDGYALLMTTTESTEEAEGLARSLVEARLAACVQLVPIVSHYAWDGQATRGEEVLLLIKTRSANAKPVTEHIEAHHSYDTPEVVVIPIESGSAAYLRWIDESAGGTP